MKRRRLLRAIAIGIAVFAVVFAFNAYCLSNGLQLTHPLRKKSESFAASAFETFNLPGILLTLPTLDLLAHKDNNAVYMRNDWRIITVTSIFWACCSFVIANGLWGITRPATVYE